MFSVYRSSNSLASEAMQSHASIRDRFVQEMLHYCSRNAGYPEKRAELRGALVQSRRALASDSVVRFAEDSMYRLWLVVEDHFIMTDTTPEFNKTFKEATRGGFDTRRGGLETLDHTNFTYSIMYEWFCRHSEAFHMLAKRLAVHYPSLHPEYHSRNGAERKGDIVEIFLARGRYYEPALELLRVETLHLDFDASNDGVRAVYGDLCKCGKALNAVRGVSTWGVHPSIDWAARPVDFAVLLDMCDFLDPTSRAGGTWLAMRDF